MSTSQVFRWWTARCVCWRKSDGTYSYLPEETNLTKLLDAPAVAVDERPRLSTQQRLRVRVKAPPPPPHPPSPCLHRTPIRSRCSRILPFPTKITSGRASPRFHTSATTTWHRRTCVAALTRETGGKPFWTATGRTAPRFWTGIWTWVHVQTGLPEPCRMAMLER